MSLFELPILEHNQVLRRVSLLLRNAFSLSVVSFVHFASLSHSVSLSLYSLLLHFIDSFFQETMSATCSICQPVFLHNSSFSITNQTLSLSQTVCILFFSLRSFSRLRSFSLFNSFSLFVAFSLHLHSQKEDTSSVHLSATCQATTSA